MAADRWEPSLLHGPESVCSMTRCAASVAVICCVLDVVCCWSEDDMYHRGTSQPPAVTFLL